MNQRERRGYYPICVILKVYNTKELLELIGVNSEKRAKRDLM